MNQDFQRQVPELAAAAVPRWYDRIHIDPILVGLLILVVLFGLTVLRSAVDGDDALFMAQANRFGLAFLVMVIMAQVPPNLYMRWAPMLYLICLILLALTFFFGAEVKGSRRWLDVPHLLRFQPSELIKIVVPMSVAWYLHQRILPPSAKHVLISLLIILVPAIVIGQQPDLGTGILVVAAGLSVLMFAGLHWRSVFYAMLLALLTTPIVWQYVLTGYQKQRILTLFDPEGDPLGAGWNIIQSTTAIGSGGLFGKGLFQGSQSYLDFLPEARTDFIVAVMGEELGFFGIFALLALYLLIIARCLFLAADASSTFGRLLAGALTMTFFVYLFVNIAMVSGLLPVVGVPLPLVSYGGTSAITLMAGFGIIMSMRSHKAW